VFRTSTNSLSTAAAPVSADVMFAQNDSIGVVPAGITTVCARLAVTALAFARYA
jgi:hypothetical protein